MAKKPERRGSPELQLPNGQSARFRTTLSHGDSAALQAAMSATFPRGTPDNAVAAYALQRALGQAEVELLEMYVRAYVADWTLTDDAGANIPFASWPPTDDGPRPDAWARIPEQTFAQLSVNAQLIWAHRLSEQRDPLAEPPSGEPSDSARPTS